MIFLNIKNCSIKSVRKNLSLVSQDTILFNDTIEANISYGKKNVHQSYIHTSPHPCPLAPDKLLDT